MFIAYAQVMGVPNIPLIMEVPGQIYQKLVPYTTIPYFPFVAYLSRKIIDIEISE